MSLLLRRFFGHFIHSASTFEPPLVTPRGLQVCELPSVLAYPLFYKLITPGETTVSHARRARLAGAAADPAGTLPGVALAGIARSACVPCVAVVWCALAVSASAEHLVLAASLKANGLTMC